MPRDEHVRPAFYVAAERFVDEALRRQGSMFAPGAAAWTSDNLADLYERFVENPDEGGDDFMTKLRGQLVDARPAVVQLMAEVLFVHLLAPDSVTAAHKRSLVEEVLSWSTGLPQVPPELDAAYSTGIARVGAAYNVQRDRQVNYLLELALAWWRLSVDARQDALTDPWAFKRFAFGVRHHSAYATRDALLYIVHPETFEPIVSRTHKGMIAKRFADAAFTDSDVDRQLADIRRRSEERWGSGFSFYSADIEKAWRYPPDGRWDAFLHWAGRLTQWPDFEPNEVAYKHEIAGRIASALDLVGSGDERWQEALLRAFSSPNNLTSFYLHGPFLSWTSADAPAAAAALRELRGDRDPVDALRAFLNHLPASTVSGSGSRTTLASFLLMGCGAESRPIYLTEVTRSAFALVGYETQGADAAEEELYAHFLGFLDTMRREAAARGVDIPDRLAAQSLMWWIVKGPPPESWDVAEQGAFRAFQVGSDPGVVPPVATRAWFVRGANVAEGGNLVPDWLERGYVSVGWRELGELTPEMSTEEIRTQLQDAFPDAPPGRIGADLGNLTRFLKAMQVGDLVATVDGDAVYVGRIASEPRYVPDVFSGSRRQRDVEWLNAHAPASRSKLIKDRYPTLFARLRTLLTVTELTEDIHPLAAVAGTEAPPPAPPRVGLPPAGRELADTLLLPMEWLQELLNVLEQRRQVIFYGPPGTGKTYVAQALADHIAGAGGTTDVIQFHPSYAYEDFFEGYRPTTTPDGMGLAYELRHGPLRRLAGLAEQSRDVPHVLVIDEINRGNLPKIFGELFFLLEYRDRRIRLQYSPEEEFRLPPNLYLIGTMNTADRSIALMDSALRRRFGFIPFLPTEPPLSGLLRRWLQRRGRDAEPAELLDELNRRLGAAESTAGEAAIGPSFFMSENGAVDLDQVWRYAIMPLLEERFYGARPRSELEPEFGLPALRRRLTAQAGRAEAAEGDGGANDA